jgi:hypothetical protein
MTTEPLKTFIATIEVKATCEADADELLGTALDYEIMGTDAEIISIAEKRICKEGMFDEGELR